MYVPAHFKPEMTPRSCELLRHPAAAANLITATADGLLATMLPLVYDEPGRPARSRAVGRAPRARGTQQRASGRRPRIGEALVDRRGPRRLHLAGLVRDEARARPGGPDLELHRPSHVYGRLVIHDDPAWVEANVRALERPPRAARAGAVVRRRRPEPYIAGQLKAIVGVEVLIDRVEGKWKLSQNRSDADIVGTIEGLEATGERDVSSAMRDLGRGG